MQKVAAVNDDPDLNAKAVPAYLLKGRLLSPLFHVYSVLTPLGLASFVLQRKAATCAQERNLPERKASRPSEDGCNSRQTFQEMAVDD